LCWKIVFNLTCAANGREASVVAAKILEVVLMRYLRSARWLLLAMVVTLVPSFLHAQFSISVHFGPPVLPVYVQPPCPQPDMVWTPGYWAYSPDQGDYYWVPGAWVPAPQPGFLWTPGYWGWSNGLFVFHEGYWGRHVGYYGGVNYGFGYGGIGFAGGEWRGGHFAYNTAVVNVNRTIIHTTYIDRTIVERNTIVNNNHVAYSGGPGGVHHDPAPEERAAEHEQHITKTSYQTQHESVAKSDRSSFAKANGGHPAHAAVERPLGAQARPEQAAHPAPMAHPAPAAQNHPAPMPRPEPSSRPAPASRPAPMQRPAPQTHPAPAFHPAPAAHPAPPSHPAPASHPAPRDEHKH
jgi:hypothetical protein